MEREEPSPEQNTQTQLKAQEKCSPLLWCGDDVGGLEQGQGWIRMNGGHGDPRSEWLALPHRLYVGSEEKRTPNISAQGELSR